MSAELEIKRGFKRRVAALLIVGIAVNPMMPVAGANGNAGAAGSLAVQSEPAGANVYIDGKLAGHTPIEVTAVEPGDHRVRVVKDGYLENSRVVTVGAAEAKNVNVKLTPHTGASASEQVTGGGGGGGSKRLLWIALAGGGAAAAAVVLLNRNHPPVAGDISVTPTATGMAGVTTYTFSSNASDEDGDALTYNWNFGDGTTGTGASPTKVFATAGTFNVTLSVSDGKETVTAPGRSVTVGPPVGGTWTGGREPVLNCGLNTVLTQNAGNIAGQMQFTSGCSGQATISTGTVSPLTHPATVTWTSVPYSVSGLLFPITTRFTGTTDATGTILTGTVTASDISGSVSITTTFRR